MKNEGIQSVRFEGVVSPEMVESLREAAGTSPEVVDLPDGSSYVFSEDCQHVLWPDPEKPTETVAFFFNATQARAVRAMRDNSRENVLLGERRLLEIMGVSTGPEARFTKYFRQGRGRHPALYAMIRTAGRGQFRVWGLFPPIGGRTWEEITRQRP